MNPLDQQYQSLLQDILDNGTVKNDRTGTGTTSLFGKSIRHHMRDGFPLLTTKKMYVRGIVAELLWFINGSTNIQWLCQNKCNIWVGDAYKKYKLYAENLSEPDWSVHIDDPVQNKTRIMTVSEFTDQIISDDEFAKKWGDLGPIYGEQWRNFGGTQTAIEIDDKGNPTRWENTGGVDQFKNMIDALKTNPDGRRIMVSAWNPQNVHLATLPPCHYGFQVYTRELSFKERRDLAYNYAKENTKIPLTIDVYGKDGIPSYMDIIDNTGWNIPKREVSLLWNQRSVDTFLGLPFNIASYGILLHMLAKEVNMVPGEIVGFLGDTHLYSNHLDAAREQISREPKELPELNIVLDEGQDFDIFNMKIENFQIANYDSHPTIKAELSN